MKSCLKFGTWVISQNVSLAFLYISTMQRLVLKDLGFFFRKILNHAQAHPNMIFGVNWYSGILLHKRKLFKVEMWFNYLLLLS